VEHSADEVVIRINSRRLMERKLAGLGVAEGQLVDVFHLIDRRDRLSPDRWAAWAADLGFGEGRLEALEDLLADPDLWQEDDELCQVFATAEALGVAEYLAYDARIVRGLDYYTGPVFEAHAREGRFRAI